MGTTGWARSTGRDSVPGGGVIWAPDQRLRVFVSSALREPAAERQAARDEVLPPIDAGLIERSLRRVLATGTPVDDLEVSSRPGGSIRESPARANPEAITWPNGSTQTAALNQEPAEPVVPAPRVRPARAASDFTHFPLAGRRSRLSVSDRKSSWFTV